MPDQPRPRSGSAAGPNGTTSRFDDRCRYQEVRGPVPKYGVRVVDLTGQLSNPQPALCQLADLDIGGRQGPTPEKAQPAREIPRSKSRTARPLKPAQLDALLASYQTGRTMKELAAELGIDRRTVSAYLRRAEVPVRRGGLDHKQVIEAGRLYEAGWSSGQLAKEFDVSADHVLKVLRRSGVTIRPRRGGPSPKVGAGWRAG